ncbi:DNA cytosine methyltransferase [Plectonema cf. radiosum LEGE 06105]|uniref:DNA (cytosine-5-)-methyltransferase n=1 Tax=Plectonema cf. radiosum LEGE 06105 TaxID=945769 RepID=A0A8J7K884_9CYAN|nr:DNA cytosine methyltransferase [Plectonema cf. radiosum LEGE 06105]
MAAMGRKLRQLDLCSGVGAGFPLAGLQLGGFKLIGFSEIDEYCSDLLAAALRYRLSSLYPGVHNYGCIKSLAFEGGWGLKPGEIEIITGSPPCQPFSIQGKRLAAADERNCFPALLRIVENYKPKYLCIENVRGLLNCPSNPGSDKSYFGYVLKELYRCGYDAEWLCVSSGHFASPFDRGRLLLVARSHGIIYKREPSPWTEQVREFFEKERADQERRSVKPGYPLSVVRNPGDLARPLGIPNRNSAIRKQRSAAGNLLDSRIAASTPNSSSSHNIRCDKPSAWLR